LPAIWSVPARAALRLPFLGGIDDTIRTRAERIAHAANLPLDLSSSNFGIQEAYRLPERTRDVFPGCPEIRDGAMWSNDRPGLGIDIGERLSARYPFSEHAYNGAWPEIRRADGTVVRP
jgi:mannonate dehydratase